MHSTKSSHKWVLPAVTLGVVGAGGLLSSILITPAIGAGRAFQQKFQPMIFGQNSYQQYENQNFTLNANSIGVIFSTSWIFGALTSLAACLATLHFAKK